MDSVPVAKTSLNDDHIRKCRKGTAEVTTPECPDFAPKAYTR